MNERKERRIDTVAGFQEIIINKGVQNEAVPCLIV